MLDSKSLPDDVLEAILGRNEWLKDEKGYAKVNRLSIAKAFEDYCEWNGLIGWSTTLTLAIDSIRSSKIDKDN